MRVHRLEIEAFGPFAERVVVDVDALSAEGLFLIHGPTGSGKTSLLDAICFALYADVPGLALQARAAQRPRGPRCRAPRRARADRRHPAAAHHALPRVPPAQEARHRPVEGAGVRDARGARRGALGGRSARGTTRSPTSSRTPSAWAWPSSPRSCCSPRASSRRSCGRPPRTGARCSSGSSTSPPSATSRPGSPRRAARRAPTSSRPARPSAPQLARLEDVLAEAGTAHRRRAAARRGAARAACPLGCARSPTCWAPG